MNTLEKCCYPNCFECPYDDCVSDTLSEAEVRQQDIYDRSLMPRTAQQIYAQSAKGKASQKRYSQSEKGRATQRRYNNSEKGRLARAKYAQSEKGKIGIREAVRRYSQSEKGKATARRKMKKDIASGRNAERCRRYYRKRKAMLELQEA